MTELPSGWASGPLSDFVAPRGEKVSPADFPKLPFVGMDHVEAHTTRIVGSVPSSQMKSRASRFYKNDVLYGRLRPYLNKVAQSKFDGLASGEFIVFEGNELIDPSFLRYRLHARDFVNFASHLNEGDRPRVNFDQIGNFEVQVPPTRASSAASSRGSRPCSTRSTGVSRAFTMPKKPSSSIAIPYSNPPSKAA